MSTLPVRTAYASQCIKGMLSSKAVDLFATSSQNCKDLVYLLPLLRGSLFEVGWLVRFLEAEVGELQREKSSVSNPSLPELNKKVKEA